LRPVGLRAAVVNGELPAGPNSLDAPRLLVAIGELVTWCGGVVCGGGHVRRRGVPVCMCSSRPVSDPAASISRQSIVWAGMFWQLYPDLASNKPDG
jgi:hypothetical protein